MRITGGEARGIKLAVRKGSDLRPATDRMREAVFSSLGLEVAGSHFVDLFAGVGSYGIEAISRGAKSGVFIEKSRKHGSIIEANLKLVAKSMDQVLPVQVRVGDAFSVPSDQKVNLLFCDPPYALWDRRVRDLQRVIETWVDREGTLIAELPGGVQLEWDGWEIRRRLGKGQHQPSVIIMNRL